LRSALRAGSAEWSDEPGKLIEEAVMRLAAKSHGKPLYRVTDRLHDGRAVAVPGHEIARIASAWLAELGAHSPLVDDGRRSATTGVRR
jgi:hypothetical protein